MLPAAALRRCLRLRAGRVPDPALLGIQCLHAPFTRLHTKLMTVLCAHKVLLAYREREAMISMKDLNRAGQPMPVRSTMKPTNTPHRKRILCYCQGRVARNIEKGFPHAMYSFLTENICNFKQIIAYLKSFSKLLSFTSILFCFSQGRAGQCRLFSDLLLTNSVFHSTNGNICSLSHRKIFYIFKNIQI